MKVLRVRNAHQALPLALRMLRENGVRRSSRNGDVLVYPEPVATVYTHPLERCVFWPERDYNVAFVLYEALWMLAGRNDLEPLTRYVKDFGRYSDDGERLSGAYGRRWRSVFGHGMNSGGDQISTIIRRLREDPEDRRCVLQMWHPSLDLDSKSRDVPCNTTATFQRDHDGRLNLVVFCRSNDVLWGAYYANAFHFSFLLEYMARKIGCEVGTYTQVSVNWHGYLVTIEPLEKVFLTYTDPIGFDVCALGLHLPPPLEGDLDALIQSILVEADSGVFDREYEECWARSAQSVLKAHHLYRMRKGDDYGSAMTCLEPMSDQRSDWEYAMHRWLFRRYQKWVEGKVSLQ